MSGGNEPRALREMIREASRDEVPELAWDRIESRLFAELDDRSSSAADDAAAPAVVDVVAVAPVRIAEREAPAGAAVRVAVALGAPALAPTPERTLRAASERGASRWGRWALAAAAVAAAVAGLWVSHDRIGSPDQQPVIVAEPIDAENIPFAPGMGGQQRDLSYLKPGDVVEAAVGPLAFGELGTVEWTLAAGSRLVVREGKGSHAVELENGSMRGAVAAATSSRLVIAAGETEIMSVAAGSIFSVTRSSRRVVVHLERGSATVGPRATGLSGRYLEAPVLAAFSLDGGSSFEVIADAAALGPIAELSAALPPPSVPPGADVREPDAASELSEPDAPASSPKLASPAASAPSSRPSAEPIASAAPPAAFSTPAGLQSTLVSCLLRVQADKQRNAAEGVRVQVDSTLSVKVQEDGSVQSAVFSPPLTPEMQSCAVFLLRARLEPGARVVSIPIHLP